MDLIVRNAMAVTVGGRSLVDIGIVNGSIAQMGGNMSARREIDAAGKIVTPGGVDAHVHLTPPTRRSKEINWSDDFESGSRAAAAGGITTVGNMSFPEADRTLLQGVEQDIAEASRLSVVDFFMHPVLLRPTLQNLECIPALQEAGHSSLKCFMSYGNFDRNVPAFLDAFVRVKQAGGIALIHCEDAAIIDCCCNVLRLNGKTGSEISFRSPRILGSRIDPARCRFCRSDRMSGLCRPLGERARAARMSGRQKSRASGFCRNAAALPSSHLRAVCRGRRRKICRRASASREKRQRRAMGRFAVRLSRCSCVGSCAMVVEREA